MAEGVTEAYPVEEVDRSEGDGGREGVDRRGIDVYDVKGGGGLSVVAEGLGIVG